jgi:hypothetical protein
MPHLLALVPQPPDVGSAVMDSLVAALPTLVGAGALAVALAAAAVVAAGAVATVLVVLITIVRGVRAWVLRRLAASRQRPVSVVQQFGPHVGRLP